MQWHLSKLECSQVVCKYPRKEHSGNRCAKAWRSEGMPGLFKDKQESGSGWSRERGRGVGRRIEEANAVRHSRWEAEGRRDVTRNTIAEASS